MQLWNDYEGRTIAEAYPLKKLVRPEGRSAFFLTTNGTGTPALVRLIEAHFDEPEILARWQKVSDLQQENLVAMRKYGQTTLDGTPLVYAVMEPSEMTLEELLQNRTLTVEEAKQLAASLIAALTALHARGLVHENIEPANIVAVGETVKLRSDCVREAAEPDGSEADIARRKAADAHSLAVVLLQALTGKRTLQGSATLLPSPFDGIIRNGLSGKWGLGEMSAALGPIAPKQVAAAAATPRPAATTQSAVTPAVKDEAKERTSVNGTPASATSKQQTAAPLFDGADRAEAAKGSTQAGTSTAKAVSPVGAETPARPTPPAQAPDVRHRIVRPVENDPRRTRLWIAAAAVLLVLLFLGWRWMRSGPTASAVTEEAKPAAATRPIPKPTPAPEIPRGSSSSSSAATPSEVAAASVPGAAKTQWRVVAFTYNHEAQAQEKAEAIKKQHPSLNPEVFSPNGRSPYLVTVGGPMTRPEAEAFKRKAREAGLPRDLYAQNYAR